MFQRSIALAVLALLMVLTIGTLGYMWIEGWGALDALWMVVITLTTIGFGEIHPLSDLGRIFTIFLIIGGVSVGTYAVSQVTRVVLETDLIGAVRARRRARVMERLKDHFIVVGYGRLGRSVVQELRDAGASCCVVEREEHMVRDLLASDEVPVVIGDGADDDVLRQAGIERAKGMAVAAGMGAESIFVTLSARQLNPKLNIVTRVESGSDLSKARRAGASSVVSPMHIGGWRMAHGLVRPNASHFLDLATLSAHDEIMLDEFLVRAKSPLAGRTLRELRVREDHQVTVVARRGRDGRVVAIPQGSDVIEAEDVLIVLGSPAGVRAFAALVEGGGRNG